MICVSIIINSVISLFRNSFIHQFHYSDLRIETPLSTIIALVVRKSIHSDGILQMRKRIMTHDTFDHPILLPVCTKAPRVKFIKLYLCTYDRVYICRCTIFDALTSLSFSTPLYIYMCLCITRRVYERVSIYMCRCVLYTRSRRERREVPEREPPLDDRAGCFFSTRACKSTITTHDAEVRRASTRKDARRSASPPGGMLTRRREAEPGPSGPAGRPARRSRLER